MHPLIRNIKNNITQFRRDVSAMLAKREARAKFAAMQKFDSPNDRRHMLSAMLMLELAEGRDRAVASMDGVITIRGLYDAIEAALYEIHGRTINQYLPAVMRELVRARLKETNFYAPITLSDGLRSYAQFNASVLVAVQAAPALVPYLEQIREDAPHLVVPASRLLYDIYSRVFCEEMGLAFIPPGEQVPIAPVHYVKTPDTAPAKEETPPYSATVASEVYHQAAPKNVIPIVEEYTPERTPEAQST